MSDKRQRFAGALKELLDTGRGSESIEMFCRGHALSLYPDDAGLGEWLNAELGAATTRQLVTLFAVQPCHFCKRGLEPCLDCEGHGHFDFNEVCERCFGFGVSQCGFCGGSGLGSIEAVPKGLRPPVTLERAMCAIGQIENMTDSLIAAPSTSNPRDTLKDQTALILRLSSLLGTLENELEDDMDPRFWTPLASDEVRRRLDQWPATCRRAEEKKCAAFQCMSQIAAQMAAEVREGTSLHSLALARSKFYAQFATPDSLDGTTLDHPGLDRIRRALP